MQKVSKIKAGNNLKEAVLKSVDEIGGSTSLTAGGFRKFIKKGETVLLKPNFNTADPYPASTDMIFLKAVIEIIYDCGAKLVMVGESSTMYLNSRKEMEKIGVFDLEKLEKPARVYVFEEKGWTKKEIPDGKFLQKVSVTDILSRPDKLILLPCLKAHKMAQFTGSLKLAIGFMKPLERVHLHLDNLQEKIAELNTLINPDLIIMDARKCFITGGPFAGTVREPDLILSSASRINIDIEGVKVIQSFEGNSLEGIDPLELPQIKLAKKLGIK